MGITLLPSTLVLSDKREVLGNKEKWWLAQAVASAACYWIPADLDRMIRGMPMPRHRVGKRELPHKLMWICPELSHGPDEFTIDSMLLRTGELPDGRSGIQGWLLGDNPEGEGWAVHSLFIPWGTRFPENIPDDSFGAMILKILAFLDSPYTVAPRHQATRSERRQLERAGYEEPTVHVIRLRSPIQVPSEPSEGQSGRQYRHRWWVRGHFRAQWYPSQQAHQVVWIAPHIKGPDGAEFKPATYAVIR